MEIIFSKYRNKIFVISEEYENEKEIKKSP
jgi:hypothetical protein